MDVIMKNLAKLLFILMFCGINQAIAVIEEAPNETSKVVDDVSIDVEYSGDSKGPFQINCFIKKGDKDVGKIKLIRESKGLYQLQTDFAEDFMGSGISDQIQKECMKVAKNHFSNEELPVGFYSSVAFWNYPSIKKNLGAGMRLVGISCEGFWLFRDDGPVKLTEEVIKEYGTLVSKECGKKIYRNLNGLWRTKDDRFGGSYTSKKFLAEKKGINNAKEYYSMIVDLAKKNNNNIVFEDIE